MSRIVHDCESVEIEEEHRNLPTAALSPCQRLLEPIKKQRAIWQASQRIIERLSSALLLQLLALSDVAGVERQATDARILKEVAGGHLNLSPAAIGVAQSHVK